MTAKKTPTEQAVTPSPLLDASGNPSLVSAGQLIESAWGNSVATRVVPRYPNKAAMDAVAATNGTLAVTLDNGIVWIRSVGVWRATTVGYRISFRGIGTPVSVPKNSLWKMTWTMSDPAGVTGGGSSLIVPVGWAGRWQFEWAVEYPAGSQNGQRLTYCEIPGGRLGQTSDVGQEGGTRMSGSGSAVLAEGDQAAIVMYHTDTLATLTCNNLGAQNYFQGYYIGPT